MTNKSDIERFSGAELPDYEQGRMEKLCWVWSNQQAAGRLEREVTRGKVKELYRQMGMEEPAVIICDSIFQLTLYPVIIALMMDETGRESALPLLRRNLSVEPWSRFWQNLDSQLSSHAISRLERMSDKLEQESALKRLNRHIHSIYQELEGRVDTHETPRLTSIGLQINSVLRAELESLLCNLDKIASKRLSRNLRDTAATKLTEVSDLWRGVENQLDLQLMPGILAQSVRALKTVLSDKSLGGSGKQQREKFRLSESVQLPNSLSEVLRLISQSSDTQELVSGLSRPIGDGAWGGARIGAYRDPAIRLIASSLQLELFKKATFLERLPFHALNQEIFDSIYDKACAEKLSLWSELLRDTYAMMLYGGVAVVCEFPAIASLDPENRFHSDTGPALRFTDKFDMFLWHGRRVTREIIDNPGSITVEQIEAEPNIEIRTILIERYGISKFLKDSGAQKIHEDEYGILYRKRFESSDPHLDEPLVVVRVHNATPEPDGFHKQYFLRVPPNISTAKEAVAWTFGLDADDYDPAVET